ncbi:hypothetical protein P280DRAFT_545119 [Massarina eburnea CBS 473.64]|uniref:Rhodopsin domain-containing protein n=1 Tax=Massarina eburnea CBS 473.64 TaxID=1395130 RepID=A0A6A6SIK8_9PLEO|nr:hypothetical protein P280DRAFT_545119 [Massarina eburnea CBS 473.64]
MDQQIVSDFNRTPVVQIVTWLCLVLSILAFFTHTGIKLYASNSLSVETILVFLSLVFGSAQSISVSLQCSNGFGKPSNTLEDGQIEAMLKSEYAATLLLFCSIAFSKFTLVAFIHGLVAKPSDVYINYGLGGFALAWLVVSIFVSAFQCQLPSPWDKTRPDCINFLSWWNTVAAMNIISEIAMVGLEIKIIMPLQMPRARKASIISLFACRLLIVVAAAIQLYLFHKDSSSPRKDDLTLGYWQSTIGNQVVQCLGIITTTLPYAKLFMESFESGLIRVNNVRWKEGQLINDSERTYKLLDVSRSSQPAQQSLHHGISTARAYTVNSLPNRTT